MKIPPANTLINDKRNLLLLVVVIGVILIVIFFTFMFKNTQITNFFPKNESEIAVVLPSDFRVVGYMPSWQGAIDAVSYNKLTHINYAFAVPKSNGDGSVTLENPPKLAATVTKAHENGVKVLLSVGGWNDGNDSGFEKLATSSTTRRVFVNNMIDLVNQYDLDGIDIDWEYPDIGISASKYTELMTELGIELRNRDKLLTAAVIAEGSLVQGVQPAVFDVVDFINIMAYDGGEPHSNYDWSINSFHLWKNRGLSAAKINLGVPFYSRPGEFDYKQAVIADRNNDKNDCATINGVYGCYNGITTIQKKTQFMLQYGGGIKFWELSQDMSDDTSLLDAIFKMKVNASAELKDR